MGNADMFDDLLGGSPDAGQNNLQVALALAAIGIPVFPCREKAETINGKLRKEKSPATKNGFKDASTDASQIRLWWKRRPYALVGMPTGAASGFAVIDLDRHDPKADGVAALAGLGLSTETLTNLRATTAGNGLHLYFKHADGITNKDNHLPKGIDVRAEGGYVIAPGTMFADGRAYGSLDLSKKAPAFPASILPPAETDRSDEDAGEKFRSNLTVDQIREYMADLPNDEDIGREKWMEVVASLNHEASALNEDGDKRPKAERDAIRQIAVDWTAKNPTYSTPEHLAEAADTFGTFKNSSHKNLRTFASIVMEVNNIRYDRDAHNAEDDFDDLGPEETGEAVDGGMFDDILGDGQPSAKNKPSKSQAKLAKDEVEFALGKDTPKWARSLNDKFAVAMISGKTVILHLKNDGKVHYGNVNDLHAFHENKRVPKDNTTVPITKVWMQSKHRRTYPEGVIFAPNRDVEGAYNHWQGFSVEPSDATDPSRGCKLFLKHLFEVVCDCNEEYYRYQLGWMAHMIQRPEEKPGVAVVYRGQKRIGKDTVFDYLGKLFVNHHVTVANQDHMVGKFNQHQEKCLLLHVQEGFWAGNKQAEGALKYLITSTQVTIEPKGVNAFQVPSVLRLFISSNERWVVPATEDEGRYFVLNVNSKRRNDHAYFGALRDEMEGDGPSNLLAYLQQYDLTGFEVRNVPSTDALGEQKVAAMKNIEGWWLNALQTGEISAAHGHDESVDAASWERGVFKIDKGDFRSSYSAYMRSKRYDGDELNEIEFGMRIKKMCESISVKQIRNARSRHRVYVLQDLKTCRDDFEKFLGNSVAWSADQQIVEYEDEEDDL